MSFSLRVDGRGSVNTPIYCNLILKVMRLFKKKYVPKSGVLNRPGFMPDIRNFNREEVVKDLAPAQWIEKSPDSVKHYLNGKYTQDGAGDCVLVSTALCNAIEEYHENGVFKMLSPVFGYALMSKDGLISPTGGADLEKAFLRFDKVGAPPDVLLPFSGTNEKQAQDWTKITEDLKQVALVYKSNNHFYIPRTMEAIAQTLEYQNHAVTCAIVGDNNFGPDSNGILHTPKSLSASSAGNWYHEITFVDFLLIGGKKYLVMEHAWGNWGYKGLGYAFMGEEWFGKFPDGNPFIFGGPAYFENLPDNWRDTVDQTKPKHTFNVDLSYGSTSDDIKALQDCLRYDGEFKYPTNTGYFGGMTLNAVMDFQKKYAITPVSGFCGPLTRAKLNELFS